MRLNTIFETYLHPKGQIGKKEFLTATTFSVFCLIFITLFNSIVSISKQVSSLLIPTPEKPEIDSELMELVNLFAEEELAIKGIQFFPIAYLLCFIAIYIAFVAIIKYSKRLGHSKTKQYVLAVLAVLTLPILPTLFTDVISFNIFNPETVSSYDYKHLFIRLYTPIRAHIAIIMTIFGVGVLAYFIKQNDTKEDESNEDKETINKLIEILKTAAFGAIILLIVTFFTAANSISLIKEIVNLIFAGTVLFYLIKRFSNDNTPTFATKTLIVTAIVFIINIAIDCIPNDLYTTKYFVISLVNLMNIALFIYLPISAVYLLLGKIEVKNMEAKDSPFSNHFISLLIWPKGMISSIDFRAMLIFIFLLMYSTITLGSLDFEILTKMTAIDKMYPYISNPFKGMAIFAFTYCIINICTKRALAKGLTVKSGIVLGTVVSLTFCLIYNIIAPTNMPFFSLYHAFNSTQLALAFYASLTLAAFCIVLYLSIRNNYDREYETFGDDSYGLSTTSYLLKIVNIAVGLFIVIFILAFLMDKTRNSSIAYIILGITICIAIYCIYLFVQRVQNSSLSASKVVLTLFILNLACAGIAYIVPSSYTVFIWQIANMASLVFLLWPTDSLQFFPEPEEEIVECVEIIEEIEIIETTENESKEIE